MATRFLDKKTEPFVFFDQDANQQRKYVLIYGDEVDTLSGQATKGPEWRRVRYRGRKGEMKKKAPLSTKRPLEMYFLDVGQGDAAFIVTPSNETILVDGGTKDRALGFLIWKYRLDDPRNEVTIDHMIVSHGDEDHIGGLIKILEHGRIHVKDILHNGIAVFKSGFNEALGNVDQGRLTTLYDTPGDLAGMDLSDTFTEWINQVELSGATCHAVNSNTDDLELPDIKLEFLAPLREPGGDSLKWLGTKAWTINGHSVVFRLVHDDVRVLFTGDINGAGGRHLMSEYTIAQQLDSHVLKAPHHGSHDFFQPLLDAIRPMITIVSSGDDPDHGHPRANFLGGVGLTGRGDSPLLFSTEIAATFRDIADPNAATLAEHDTLTTFDDLDFAESSSNIVARLLFKQVLPGIINVRSSGSEIYAARRIAAWYQWESYGPIGVT